MKNIALILIAALTFSSSGLAYQVTEPSDTRQTQTINTEQSRPASAFAPAPSFVKTPDAKANHAAGAPAISSSANITPNISGTGSTGFIARWTNNTGNLGNSTLFQNSLGNVGLATTTPTQKFQVNLGNVLVKGVNNFTASGHQAKLFLGDTNHPITATYGSGTAIGAYLAPNAIFVHDKNRLTFQHPQPSARKAR